MTTSGRRSPGPAASHATLRMRAELWGVLDQSLVSGVNFLTIILLARALAPSDFGYFVLAFTFLQSAGMLQASLITRPHNVLGAFRGGRAYVDYSTTATAAQLVFTCVVAAISALAAGVAYAAGFSHTLLVLALIPAIVSWQLQEFGRRMLYTESRLAAAFVNDAVSYGGLAAGLLVLTSVDALTGERALLVLSASFALGGSMLAWTLRSSFSGRLDAAALRESWQFGKWLGGAEVGQWFSTHFYIYLAGAIVGPVASAVLKAGQTLLGPISVYLTFVTSYLPVVLVRQRKTLAEPSRVRRTLIASLSVVTPYCLLIAVFAEPVLEYVYGAEYGGYANVVRLFALYYVLLTFSTVVVAALSATGLTRSIFVGHAAGACLSLAIGWMLLRELGASGGVAGMLLSWALAMSFFLSGARTGLQASVPRTNGRGIRHVG